VTELFTQRAHDCAGFGTARTFDLGNAGSALEGIPGVGQASPMDRL